MTPVYSTTDRWLEAMVVASAELPARRRLVRPLRQRVDLKFVRADADLHDAGVDPEIYDPVGRSSARQPRPGSLLNVRV